MNRLPVLIAMNRVSAIASSALLLALATATARGQVTGDVPAARPDAIVNLATREGVALVKGEWRYSDTTIVEVDHRAAGPDLKPSGALTRAYDIRPQAGGDDFDDRSWQVLDPEQLDARRSKGRLAFNWYRINVTIPEKVGSFDTKGSTVVFEVVVDDYAEIWVDGRLPLALGQAGGHVVRGFNAPNRLVVARHAQPGQRIQLAVFGMNGPISSPPQNFIWLRSATLDFYRPDRIGNALVTGGDVLRLDAALDAIVSPGTQIERIAGGFGFTEGPVWAPEGHLLFSDPNNNVIYRWTPDGQVSVHRTKSGYAGPDIGDYKQPGSNGLAIDLEGRLTIAEHGNRRVTRIEKNGVVTVLADRYEGKRLNSPNDLVYKSDGAMYFTDPPFGLPKTYDDARKELPYSGVFRWFNGRLQLVAKDLAGPNGIAFSPDEKYLYVANWDTAHKIVMRYAVALDGSLTDGRVFFDMTSAPGEEALDGVKVDRQGNLFVSGPGGVWILSAEGRHLGTIRPPELPANMAWGDADGRTLYMTGRTGLYRIRLNVPGARLQTTP
ncbi:MAG TPA: SMP-30/gluconolactonase/LRE family protein [Vicinamibacterales bacterium]|nr:SMP-30/gluconolactonase/LRE family protein [Vicinamibacterales bacterium]